VIEPGGTFLNKARESLVGARAEYEAGRYNNAANRSYYAVFQAAIHALQLEGIRLPGGGTSWGHSFVDAQFSGLLVNRRHRYEPALRTIVGDNRSLRDDADYTTIQVTQVRASRAVQRAERLVRAVLERHEERT
jgi:uncharacterized protein (UPF0332 family)